MASNRSRKSVTIEDVKAVSTYMGMLELFRQMDFIPPDGDLETLRQIMIRQLQQGGSRRRDTTPLWDTTSAASNEDMSNRTRLREFYLETISYVENLPPKFKDSLNQIFPNYIQQMKEYLKDLESSKCTLLVAGEMGAGKSSLVNLLLGAPILPTSDLRCTSAIVEISYGELPRAEMYFRDDSSGRSLAPIKIESRDTAPSQQFITALEDHVTKRDPEMDESPYEKIQVFWPVEVLKRGVMIVDSPGVGDSRNLPQQLSDYMKHAFGFIYVVDSTAAVHKQRLGQLLMKAMEENGSNFFDVDTAIFVCNRWDMIPAEDSQNVITNIADRLSMIIPGIQQSQLYPISVKKALQSKEYGEITTEHRQLIEGIRRFLPQAMRGKLRMFYRYLSSLLKRSLYRVRLSHSLIKKNVSEMKKEAQQCDQKIKTLHSNSEKTLNEMRKEVKTATMDASSNIVKHVESMRTRPRLLTWSGTDCPRKEKWQNVVKNANFLIGDRVRGEINRWEQGTNFEDEVLKGIVNKFEKSFELLSHEVKEIEGVFLSADDRITVLDFHRSMKKPVPKKKPTKASKDDSFLSLGAAVATLCTLDAKNNDIRKMFRDKYDKEPAAVMASATEMCLSCITEVKVFSVVSKYLERFMKGIDEAGRLVPNMIQANQSFLEDLAKEMNQEESTLRSFPALSKRCSNIQGKLDMFYLQRLLVPDFTADQLEYPENDPLGHGSFASVYKATLRTGGQTKIVALKEPKHCITEEDVTDLLLEESMLREVDNVNIVKYYGMYKKGPNQSLRLNMVMEFCPFTLKEKYITDDKNAPSKFGGNPQRQMKCIEIMTNLLIQIINGLSYLHQKSIVHRDLKPENVLLTENSKVKIADLGLAKKVKDIVTVTIGTPVYMAPEVLLLPDKYDTKADIYGFAMIAWELWYGTDLAHYASMELQGGLKTEIEKNWRPSLSLVDPPPEHWQELIQVCWAQDQKMRPTARDVGRRLLQIFDDVRKSQRM